MGFIATDLARIPSDGFSWYVLLLTDGWRDGLRDELDLNFERLAAAVGPDCLVVKGADPTAFYNDLVASGLVERAEPTLPAVMVSSHSPEELDQSQGGNQADDPKIMLFPLGDRYLRAGSVTDFLRELAATLSSHDPGTLPQEQANRWAWLPRYFDIKPNFFGIGVDFDRVIEDLF